MEIAKAMGLTTNAKILADLSTDDWKHVILDSYVGEVDQAIKQLHQDANTHLVNTGSANAGHMRRAADLRSNRHLARTYIKYDLSDINDPVCRDLCDPQTTISDVIVNASMDRLQWSIDKCLELDQRHNGAGFYKRAEALHQFYKVNASGHLVTRLGDPRPDRIYREGRWVKPTTWMRNHERIGRLIKGAFICDKCALEKDLSRPAAIAVYPVNILPYSQCCKSCGTLMVSGLRKADGSGDYLELFDGGIKQ